MCMSQHMNVTECLMLGVSYLRGSMVMFLTDTFIDSPSSVALANISNLQIETDVGWLTL